jgi:two-component system sensor histidine kinase YesM
MGVVYNAQEVVKASTDLSRLLRYSIKGDDMVTVQDELEALGNYIDIMRIRFGDRYSTAVEAEGAVLGHALPKMTLQPLVENAYTHGLEGRPEGGRLWLTAAATTSGLMLEVGDNGAGIPPDTLAHIHRWIEGESSQSNDHMGLYSVIRRLRLHYGAGFAMQIESGLGRGTRICIRLDAPPANPAEKM